MPMSGCIPLAESFNSLSDSHQEAEGSTGIDGSKLSILYQILTGAVQRRPAYHRGSFNSLSDSHQDI